MVKSITGLVLLGALPMFVLAQDKIETDRPTESQNTKVVSKGTFQSELGFRVEGKNDQDHSYQHPEAVFRYGLFNGFELRLRTAIETQHFRSENISNHGLKPVEVGLKAKLLQTTDTTFSTSLYGNIGFPRLASKDHQHDKTFYRIRLLFENKLSDKIKLNYNLGRDWDSEEKQQNWIYTISPQFELSDKWQAFLEGYGYFQKNSRPEHYIDGGFAYLISNNVQLDINAGKGISSKADDYFITTGISFKL